MIRLALAAAALALAVTSLAWAATPLKTARSGDVSLRVPAAWKVTARRGAIPLVATARRPAGGYVPNVTVVSGPVRGDASVEDWRREITQGLPALVGGAKPRSRLVRLPAGRAVEVSLTSGRQGKRPRLLLYAIDAGRKAYVVTFTAGASVWGRFDTLFRAMARSVRIRR